MPDFALHKAYFEVEQSDDMTVVEHVAQSQSYVKFAVESAEMNDDSHEVSLLVCSILVTAVMQKSQSYSRVIATKNYAYLSLEPSSRLL